MTQEENIYRERKVRDKKMKDLKKQTEEKRSQNERAERRVKKSSSSWLSAKGHFLCQAFLEQINCIPLCRTHASSSQLLSIQAPTAIT